MRNYDDSDDWEDEGGGGGGGPRRRGGTSGSGDGNSATTDGTASSARVTSWVGHKERGRRLYDSGDYEGALRSYLRALSPDDGDDDDVREGAGAGGRRSHGGGPPDQERQILLSNVVACRLKVIEGGGIGSAAARRQAELAVRDAKSCVSINPSWGKGHVRLASAYVALGGHSNEACNSLQTALRIDPGNSAARQMLVRELRRDHRTSSSSAAAAPSSSDDRPPPLNPNYAPPPNDATTFDDGNNNARNHRASSATIDVDDVDDAGPSFQEKMWFRYEQAKMWYLSLSESNRSILKVLAALLVLYVAFGGRFGLEYLNGSGDGRGGSYDGSYGGGRGNSAYDQYRQRRRTESSYSSGSYSGGGSYDHGGYDPYRDRSYSAGRTGSGGYGYRSSSSSGFHLFDGSLQSMALLAAAVFACHRLGISPWQALFMMNAAGRIGGRRGGRRPRAYGGMGGGGFGYGGGGMGGMGGMRYGRHRGRGWY